MHRPISSRALRGNARQRHFVRLARDLRGGMQCRIALHTRNATAALPGGGATSGDPPRDKPALRGSIAASARTLRHGSFVEKHTDFWCGSMGATRAAIASQTRPTHHADGIPSVASAHRSKAAARFFLTRVPC